jgi:thiol-disulfide isomerase/thioredoxin
MGAHLPGLLVAAAVLAVATLAGLWRRRVDGVLHAVPGPGSDDEGERLTAADLETELGPRATLVQFSSAVCAACDAARRVLSEETDARDGVVHVEIDAEQRLDLARQLSVFRTPTVLVLDAHGRIAHRASGAPRRAEVRAALDALPA